ncbi:hypothetical protein [Streptomyces spinosirectus]
MSPHLPVTPEGIAQAAVEVVEAGAASPGSTGAPSWPRPRPA